MILRAFLIIFLLFVAAATFMTGNPISTPLGFGMYAVTSGSMMPQLPIGGLLITRRIQARELRVGDVIAFRESSGSDIITHRVIEIISSPEKTGRSFSFMTKRDANGLADADSLSEDKLVGKVSVVIPYVGFVFLFMVSPLGFVTGILVPSGLLLFLEMKDLFRPATLQNQEKGET